MEPGFWHEKWHQQQIGFHQQDINPFLVKYWQKLGLPADTQVFVPLCGKSLDMCFLAEQGHQVIGCELNELAVQQFFSDNQLEMTQTTVGEHQHYHTEQISLYQGDIFTLPKTITQEVTAFYDRAALIAWPESMRAQYAKQLASLLPSGSVGLLVTLDYPQEALSGPPFAVSPTWVEQHLSDDFDIEVLASQDVLADNPRFIKKAVPWLNEAAYLLKRK
ncbi:thiopurine S-methyltransferase [Shewanella baltica]|uniref:thiopurine S-methyltransferase n=1 Tax=Shewanella baltica TaxID=62322 RepID=UPI00217EDADF|nr:thiopurine S-methyltransferase [Shewanella baltica]MCS6191937.1 thiopurine S-methyltransferase [Shewanella baltica]